VSSTPPEEARYRAAVTAVVLGLATALLWGVTSLGGARASRSIGAAPALAWVCLIGVALSVPLLAVDPPQRPVSGETLAWLAAYGIANVVGLLLAYAAVRRVKVGIVSPIVSTEGSIAALIAIAAGEAVAGPAIAVMAMVAVGVVLVTVELDGRIEERPRPGRRFVVLAILGALSLGFSLYAGGRISADVPVAWLIATGRISGVVLVALPLLLRRGLVRSREAWPWLAITAVAEVLGVLTYVLGARASISITAVLASQFAAVAVLGAYLFLGERLTRLQWAGVALIAVGVAAVAALQAA
jgi:DME family drug/metabolite transporter